MTLLGSVDISFTKSTKIAVDATDTAGRAENVAHQATDTASQAKSTAESANQTATQAKETAKNAEQVAQTAITTANGKNKAYYGKTTPISPQPGDIWFVEDSSGNVTAIKHYDGTQWVTDVDNTALAQQISAAQAAADNAATVGQTAQQVAQQAAQVGDSAAKTAAAAQQAANAAQTDAANAVSKNDVINQINVSTEGILIDGRKVHITGQTTIDNAVIKDAMIQSMTADKLTAGTIDANVITVKNINASNIVTGTLDASKATIANIDASKITTGTLNAARIAAGSIDASKLNVTSLSAISANIGNVTAGNISGVNINIGNGNFTVDTSGNLVAKNANITGVINATSGSFSGELQGATGTFKGQMTAGSINIGGNFSVDSNGNLTAKSGTFSGILNGATFVGNTINIDNELNVRNGSISVTSDVQNPWGYYDSIKINPTYRFPIHVEDDDTNHTYISSGMIELYSPDNPELYASESKLTITSDLISFSGGAALGTDAIYAVDYFNRESIIDGKGNAQFRNIKLNGYHSIISLDGGSLYFTDPDGDRIDINAKWVRPNNMAFGYHTIASLDGKKLFFTNNTSNGNRIDIGIATLDYSGSLSKSSSETLKSNIEPISFSAINEIMKTDFYSYNYISDLDRGITKPNFGPVIGDKYHLSDKFLSPDGDSVSIDNATFINSQAIKELYKDMQKQNQQIVLKIADLEARLAKLEE